MGEVRGMNPNEFFERLIHSVECELSCVMKYEDNVEKSTGLHTRHTRS